MAWLVSPIHLSFQCPMLSRGPAVSAGLHSGGDPSEDQRGAGGENWIEAHHGLLCAGVAVEDWASF